MRKIVVLRFRKHRSKFTRLVRRLEGISSRDKRKYLVNKVRTSESDETNADMLIAIETEIQEATAADIAHPG